MPTNPSTPLSTKTDDAPAKHGLTVIHWHGWYQGRCECDWDTTATSVMSVQLRFGEHLLETEAVGGVL